MWNFVEGKEEYLSGILLILGFLMFWADFFSIGVLFLLSGLAYSAHVIWKNPIIGVYMTIFFLPLTKTVDLLYFGTKIALPEILFGLTFLSYLFNKQITLEKICSRFKDSYFLIPLGAFLLLSTISGVNAVSLERWFVEVAAYFYLALFFLFIIYALDSEEKINLAIKTLITSLAGVILVGFLGYILYAFNVSNNPFVHLVRVTSTFKAVNQFSISVLVGFFLIINKAQFSLKDKSWKEAIGWFIISVLGIFVFLASGTRMVPIVLLPALILYCVIDYTLLVREESFSFIGILLLLLTLSFILAPLSIPESRPMDRAVQTVRDLSKISYTEVATTISESKQSVEGSREISVTEEKERMNEFWRFVKGTDASRYLQLRAFMGMVKDFPIIGVGAGNFKIRMSDYTDSPRSWEMHNTFLGVIAEEGILGFLAFISFLVSLLVLGIKKRLFLNPRHRNYLYLVGLGLLSHFMYTMVQFGLRSRHLWLGLGMIGALIGLPERD